MQRLKKNSKVVDAENQHENQRIADFAALAVGKYLHVAPTSVKIVSQRDAVTEFEYRAVVGSSRSISSISARADIDLRQ